MRTELTEFPQINAKGAQHRAACSMRWDGFPLPAFAGTSFAGMTAWRPRWDRSNDVTPEKAIHSEGPTCRRGGNFRNEFPLEREWREMTPGPVFVIPAQSPPRENGGGNPSKTIGYGKYHTGGNPADDAQAR
jgi:hypothetical protein